MICTTFRSDFCVGWKNQNTHSTLISSFNALSKWHEPDINYDFLSVQGIKCYKGWTTDDISSMPSQKTESDCTEGVTQCLKIVLYSLYSGYYIQGGNKKETILTNSANFWFEINQ